MQTKYKFDKVSVIKMLKGALIAATGAAALYILDWIGSIEVGSWTPIIAAIVPALVNVVKEWLKGEKS